ncbi:MAG: hemerythrin family protein [Rhodoferax sp.]|nr:hemerythrin family protein [Rhodoferax sp.]
MAIEWKEKFMIGDGKIDAEHQEWFRLANQFLLADGAQAMQACGDAFSQYTRHHFFHEEVLMREMQFPFTATHVKDHDTLWSTLEKILDVAGKNVLSKEEMEDFVGYWLVNHIVNFDKPFAVYVKRRCTSPA